MSVSTKDLHGIMRACLLLALLASASRISSCARESSLRARADRLEHELSECVCQTRVEAQP